MKEKIDYSNITILIVEDELQAREALASMLSIDFKHVYQADNGHSGLAMFVKHKPDVVLTDIKMPDMNGLEMLREIRKINHNSLVVFTTAFGEVEMLQKAIDLKATAYLIKPIQYTDILDKISSNLHLITLKQDLHTKLSKREYAVFLDIVKGVKPISTAQRFDIKPKTVSTYRKRILDKFAMQSNVELIKYAFVNQIE
ncbi:response regulator [Sulfurimonas sp. SAG-AH-194-C21]|nr:response regulator [Sulfurimonas sp. SAG-AH-194-C21]MDF1883274.1 response regulator [Sulfurimonas sp. SAG-AH-194-C21]